MKARFVFPSRRHCVELHFSHELPLFPRRRVFPFGPPMIMLMRTANIERVAHAMAVANRGKFSVELSSPHNAYEAFLGELLYLEGLEMVVEADRYTLTLGIGRCFDAESVCRAAAKCVRRHFYPSELLRCETGIQSTRRSTAGSPSRQATR